MTTLKDIVSIQPKSKMNVCDASNTGEYPFFNCSEENNYTHNSYLLDGEYVLVSTGGSRPNIRYFKGKFSYSSHVLVLSAENTIFLYYYLLKNKDFFLSKFKGAAFKNLNEKEFFKLKIENCDQNNFVKLSQDKENKSNRDKKLLKNLLSIELHKNYIRTTKKKDGFK